MGKDKPSSNENFEESYPKRGRFELLVDDSGFFWYLEESKVDCPNKYMEKFVSNWVLQKENIFNYVPGNVLNAKPLDQYLRKLLTEQKNTFATANIPSRHLPAQSH